MLTWSLSRTVSILCLCLLSVCWPQSAHATNAAAKSRADLPDLPDLLEQRKELLVQIASQLNQRVLKGDSSSLTEQLQCIDQLTDTELELADSPQDRISILKQAVARLQEVEKAAEERVLIGIATPLEQLETTSSRQAMSLRLAVAAGDAQEQINALRAARLQTQREVVKFRELVLNAGGGRNTGPDFAGFVRALNRLRQIRIAASADTTQRLDAHTEYINALLDLEKMLTLMRDTGSGSPEDLGFVIAKRCQAQLHQRRLASAPPEDLLSLRNEWKQALTKVVLMLESRRAAGSATFSSLAGPKADLLLAELDDTSEPEQRVAVFKAIAQLKAEAVADHKPRGGLNHLLAQNAELSAQIDLARAQLTLITPMEEGPDSVPNAPFQSPDCRVPTGLSGCCPACCCPAAGTGRRAKNRCGSRRRLRRLGR